MIYEMPTENGKSLTVSEKMVYSHVSKVNNSAEEKSNSKRRKVGQSQDVEAKSSQPQPPDGGWGWLVMFASLCNMMLGTLLNTSFSILFTSFFVEKRTSTTKTAWIFNTNQFMWTFSVFFGSSLCVQFGWRTVSFVGGLTMAAASITNTFVSQPEYLFLTFSLISGIGQGLCVVAALSVVPHYFHKRKGFAAGISIAGISVAQFVGPLLVQHLLENYSYYGTNLILGAFLLHACFFSLFFHPVEWHTKTEKHQNQITCAVADEYAMETNENTENLLPEKNPSLRVGGVRGRRRSSTPTLDRISVLLERSSSSLYLDNVTQNADSITAKKSENKTAFSVISDATKLIIVNLKVMKYHRVKIISLSVALVLISYINFLMVVPLALASEGHSLSIISWSVASAGLCNFFFRIGVSILIDILPLSTKYYFMAGAFGLSLSMIMVTFTTNPKIILLVMSIAGGSAGTALTLISLLSLEFVGLKHTGPTIGLNGLLSALLFLSLGPFVGFVRDVTQSFKIAIRILSFAPILAFISWLLMPCAITSDAKIEENNDTQTYI